MFPANLRGMTVALALYQPMIGESFNMIFRGTQGQAPFDLVMQIASAILSESQKDLITANTEIVTGVAQQGWVFVTNQINTDIVVNSEGNYDVFLNTNGQEQYVGNVTLARLVVPPYTPDQILAIKSDPLAKKFVRLEFICNSCGSKFKAYAGVERSASLESQGFHWNLDIKEDEFVCSCGKARISLITTRTGLHGFLQRDVTPQTNSSISAVRLYETTALEEFCRELLKLIESDSKEEVLQTFLEAHPIFFHMFVPRRIAFKPPILTKYFADFAVLNARNELLLIEIERPGIALLKKDGNITADLGHAFYQVRCWTQVLNDHRAAALDAINMKLDEVAKVKGIVVAGRKPSDERMLRLLRSVSTSEVELFTYDDLLSSVTELIKHVANV